MVRNAIFESVTEIKKGRFRSFGGPSLVLVVSKKINSITLNAEVMHAVAIPHEVKRTKFWTDDDDSLEV